MCPNCRNKLVLGEYQQGNSRLLVFHCGHCGYVEDLNGATLEKGKEN